MAQGCVFCAIAGKKTPAKIVSESDRWISFHDVRPQAPVHILLVPKTHVENIAELEAADPALSSSLFSEATRLTRELNLREVGYRIVINCNRNGGQTVPHLHMHILGGRAMAWPPG